MGSKLGIDKWDDVDRWTRNQLAENQLTQTAWLTDGHLDYSRVQNPDGPFDAKLVTTDHVAERALGAFAGWPAPNDWVSAEDWWGGDKHPILSTVMNCCTSAGSRALYSVWRDMIDFMDGTLRVHLLLNRASKWADIDSYVPYTGRTDIKIKQALKLEVRLPEWVRPDQLACRVDGEARSLSFAGRYALIGDVEAGQTVALTFPIEERTEKRNIEGFDYTFVIRGNDAVSVDPPGKYAPLYQRAHYRGGTPLFRKTTRFVPIEVIEWW